MGYLDRATTDRYVTFNPKVSLEALKQMPNIDSENGKKSLILIKGNNGSGKN